MAEKIKIDKDRNTKKVFEFLKHKEHKNKSFTLKELMDVSGWKASTVRAYLSKRLHSYIKKCQEKKLMCKGIINLSENDFLSLLSQTNKNQKIIVNNEDYIYKAKAFALIAVTIYNNPCLEGRAYSYIVNIIIAWTALFHSLFIKAKIYPRNSGKDEHTWSLKTCLNKYQDWKDDDEQYIKANLLFLIHLRNIIEHQALLILPDKISVYLQASLLNFEKILENEFQTYLSDSKLTLSLQFGNSTLNTYRKLTEQTCSRAYKPIFSYIKQFEEKNPSILHDQRVRVSFIIDKELTNNVKRADDIVPSNTKCKDLADVDSNRENVVAIKKKPSQMSIHTSQV